MDRQGAGYDATQHVHREHLVAALGGGRSGIITLDRRLAVLFTNPRLAELLEIPRHGRRTAHSLIELLEASPLIDPATVQVIHEACVTTINGGLQHDARVQLPSAAGARILGLCIDPLEDGTWLASFEDVTERDAAEASAVETAMRDPLTGLLNRRLFESRVTTALAEAASSPVADIAGEPAEIRLAVLLVDLDRFKAVNDTLGHPVGDSLLGLVSKRLCATVRQGDLVARLGGDEFGLLITLSAGQQALADLAARIVDLLGRPYLVDGHLVNIGASIGLAVAPRNGTDYQTLLRSADLALYDAKASGRNAFRFFSLEMDERAMARRSLEIDLRKALALQQFELHYQPQVDLDSNEIVGFEALVRWRHPERGLMSPATFIPVAEEIGLIVPIGEWVMREACREASGWPDHVTVAVNVSPSQFEDVGRLTDCVVRSLRLTGLPGHRLEIEITEGALLRSEVTVLDALRQLRAMNVRVAMDDFGTGYSSLSQLRSFPFDKIKIDQSFVRGDGDVESKSAIIRAINALGASLGMVTIAEGVETQDQLERLRAEGCRSVQGFLFSRPVAPQQIAALLADFQNRA